MQSEDVARIAETAAKLQENIEKVLVGKGDVVALVLEAVLCEGHLLIQDVPGTGKTVLAKCIARSLGCTFRRVQGTPDLLPTDITGTYVFNQQTSAFEFRSGPIMSQVLLVDEINRATPRTQSALLEAMQERQITVEGETMTLAKPFLTIATQNPIELEGTFHYLRRSWTGSSSRLAWATHPKKRTCLYSVDSRKTTLLKSWNQWWTVPSLWSYSGWCARYTWPRRLRSTWSL